MTAALYVLPLLVSVYGSTIRAVLSFPPEGAFRVSLLQARGVKAARRLQQLEQYHNNPHELILFVFSFLIRLSLIALFVIVTVIPAMLVRQHPFHHPHRLVYINSLLMWWPLMRGYETLRIIRGLQTYPKTSTRLRTKIARLQAQLDKLGKHTSIADLLKPLF